MTGSDPPDWSEIRRLYIEGMMPVTAIAKRHGISVRRIYHRRSIEGWPSRNRDVPPPRSVVTPLARSMPAADVAARSLKARRALVRRLYKAIDTKLQQMERRMAHDMATDERSSDATAADHERDTRAIGALIANLKRLETCAARFANAINYRGFPHIPGNDFVTAVAQPGSTPRIA